MFWQNSEILPEYTEKIANSYNTVSTASFSEQTLINIVINYWESSYCVQK